MKFSLIILLISLQFGVSAFNLEARVATNDKCRLIVTTDLGGSDPDDVQSMIHLLVCSNVIDIEGLISSQAWVNDPDHTEKITEVVNRFGEVLPRLKRHAAGYPDIEFLRSIVKRGQGLAHMDGVGQGKDSPGSEHIISVVDNKNDKRPVWLAAWGGMNTIAQALWKVKNTRSNKDLEKFISKIRIYDVLGQDDAGAWIAKTFPELTYIRNTEVYGWGPSDEWIHDNIQRHKPFGQYYPKRIWAPEGDSPAFFYVYANGLNVPDSLDFGGWGGRFSRQPISGIRGMDFVARSGKDEARFDPYYMHGSTSEGCGAIIRWKQHILNDFAARMSWTATDDYATVNHHPVAAIGRDKSLRCLYRNVKAGQSVRLDASRSDDPDGDDLRFNWIYYAEPSGYKGNVVIDNANAERCSVRVPADAQGTDIHIILELTDDASPALTVYRRVVLSVK